MNYEAVLKYAEECYDWEGPFSMTPHGALIVKGEFLRPTPWAQEQLCKAAGCTPKFYQILAQCHEGNVFNKILNSKVFLFRCHRDKVRAVLSTRYNNDISNVWVVEEIVKRVNFMKVLSADSVVTRLKYFTDDYMAVEVSAGDTKLLILNGETGRVALAFMIQIMTEGSPLTSVVHRKIHVNTDVTVTEEVLTKSVATVVTKVNSLKPMFLETRFKVRKVDLRLIPYPKDVKRCLFDVSALKEKGVVEMQVRDLLTGATAIEDFRWNLIVSCDLFNVCTSLSKYVKDGWLVNWPIRTNWLR